MVKLLRLLSEAKAIIFSVTILIAIIFVFSANSFVRKDYKLKLTISSKPLHSIKDNESTKLRSINVKEERRRKFFQKKLQELELSTSENGAQRFHGRILEFLDHKCEVQFFMIWISPLSSFSRREFLAMESLFKAHPNGCLIILSATMDSLEGSKILKPLTERGFKVGAIKPHLQFLFDNTPAEKWIRDMMNGEKGSGRIPIAQNLSNLIRLAVIYKYGGVYLDTDLIILKSLMGLRNSIGAQSIHPVSKKWRRLNNAVLIFDRNHTLVYEFIQEFAETFNGNIWGHNGPYLVSRVAEKVAGKPEFNVTIMPPAAFYPVDWNGIGGFFKKPESQTESRWVQETVLELTKGNSYGVHLWNKLSRRIGIEQGSVMAQLISHHCIICDYVYNL
ncbi:uncharacterized protein LOC126682999 [Mercurialis annua]|uniref:uncharacterized protein LOC126682999 n=1 Tax=Mercurialis annua TaxID=3986 RepID=UPI00215FCBB3|nr:uncharacterized protein LOC126682999 [Mercurialis annua]